MLQCQRTMLLHHLQELDDDLGAGADHDLALAGLLGVVDGLERIVEDGCFDHCGGSLRFSGRSRGVRYLQRCRVSLQEPSERESALQCGEALEGSSARSSQAQ